MSVPIQSITMKVEANNDQALKEVKQVKDFLNTKEQ
jgi:hypothetical protein